MKRKFLSVAVSCIMLSSSFSGCTSGNKPAASVAPVATAPATSAVTPVANDPFQKYATPITLNIGQPVDPNEKMQSGDTLENSIYTRAVKDNLNIDIKDYWTAGSGNDYDQKVNLSISSNDLPDAMVVNDTQFRTMVKAGELEDLKPAFDKYASPTMKAMFEKTGGKAMENVTYNGKMYALPTIAVPDDGYTLVWVRKDWLDKLGLKPPKTIDDLKNIAKEFVTKDPGGNGAGKTIGMVGPQNGKNMYNDFLNSTNLTYGFDPIFSASDAYPGFWIKGADGNVSYGSIAPETKTALTTLADMYKQGLIDPQMGIRKDSAAPIISGQAGIACGVWWFGYAPLPDIMKTNPKANWQSYMLQDSKGVINNHMGSISFQYCVVKKGYKNPEAVILLNNLLMRDESTYDKTKGSISDFPVRINMAYPDETDVTRKALLDVLNGKTKIEDYNTPEYASYKLLKDDVSKIAKVKLAPFDNNDIQYWDRAADPNAFNRFYSLMVGANPIYTETVNKVYSATYSQTKSMGLKWDNLRKMENETFLKIVMGQAPISDFDTFVTNWKAQGGDDITKEVQAAAQK